MKNIIKREIQDSLNGNIIMNVIIYKSPEDCIKKFFNDAPLDEIKEICGADGQGKEYQLSIPEMIENIKKTKCWGFCHDKEEIHIWLGRDCRMSDLIHLLGHERGHSIKPYHRIPEKEERKAELFGQTAKFAYEVAMQIKKEVNECDQA